MVKSLFFLKKLLRLGLQKLLMKLDALRCVCPEREAMGSDQNMMSTTTCERFQPVASFARGCVTSFRQNWFWMVGMFWASDVRDHSRRLPTFALLHLQCKRIFIHSCECIRRHTLNVFLTTSTQNFLVWGSVFKSFVSLGLLNGLIAWPLRK